MVLFVRMLCTIIHSMSVELLLLVDLVCNGQQASAIITLLPLNYKVFNCFDESVLITLQISVTRDKYSKMSHCQGNTKLEYNGSFRVQLQTFIGITRVRTKHCVTTS